MPFIEPETKWINVVGGQNKRNSINFIVTIGNGENAFDVDFIFDSGAEMSIIGNRTYEANGINGLN